MDIDNPSGDQYIFDDRSCAYYAPLMVKASKQQPPDNPEPVPSKPVPTQNDSQQGNKFTIEYRPPMNSIRISENNMLMFLLIIIIVLLVGNGLMIKKLFKKIRKINEKK